MDKNRVADATVFAFFGAIAGVIVLAYLLFATGMIGPDTKTITEQHFWRDWISATGGWGGGIFATLAAAATIIWLRRQHETMSKQVKISQEQFQYETIREIEKALDALDTDAKAAASITKLHKRLYSLIKNPEYYENNIDSFCEAYQYSYQFFFENNRGLLRFKSRSHFENHTAFTQIGSDFFDLFVVFLGKNPKEELKKFRNDPDFVYRLKKFWDMHEMNGADWFSFENQQPVDGRRMVSLYHASQQLGSSTIETREELMKLIQPN